MAITDLQPWPLILLIQDGYDPRIARFLIDAIKDLDEESCAVTIKLYAMDVVNENN